MHTNEGHDRVLGGYDGLLGASAELYAGGRPLTDPLLSTVYGELNSLLPPTLLVSGTRDLFLSDIVRFHRKLIAAHAIAELHLFEGLSHAEHVQEPHLAEADDVYECLAKFASYHLHSTCNNTHPTSPRILNVTSGMFHAKL